MVIRNVFFTGGSTAFARRHDSKFPEFTSSEGVLLREVPIHLLAFVATAVRVTY